MTAQKQSLPSFASILSVLSIVFYCAGFLRVELELNAQKKRINTLESVAETKPSSHVPDLLKLTKNSHGKFVIGNSKDIEFITRFLSVENLTS